MVEASALAKRAPWGPRGRPTFLYNLPWLLIAVGGAQAPPYPGTPVITTLGVPLPHSPISGRSLPRWGQECPRLTSVPRRRLGRDHTRQRCARGAAQGEVMVTPAQACGEHWGHPACKCSGAWTRGVVGSGRP